MAEGKSGVRGKLTWVEGEGEGGGGDRFARHALYHEDSFREHRYFSPINPDFFFTGFPRFPTGKISRRAFLPLPVIFEMMENGGKSGVDTSMNQEGLVMGGVFFE